MLLAENARLRRRILSGSLVRPPRVTIWPTLPLSAWTRPPTPQRPYPLGEPNFRLFARARHGLWQGARALGLKRGDTVLVPAYHHGSEVEALRRARLRCRFYEIGETLEPDQGELEQLLDESVRALYIIHYFGLPQNGPRWRAWCDRHRLLLLEDAAMAFLSTHAGRPVGSFGHLAIYCLYKTFALPDGGALVTSVPAALPTASAPLGALAATTRHGSWLAQRSSAVSTALFFALGRREIAWGQDFDLGDPNNPASRATTALIPRLVDSSAAHVRRDNYRRLLETLVERLPPVFPTLPEGASPIAYIARLDPEVQARLGSLLAEAGIRLANFWLAPHPLLGHEGFGRSRSLRRTIVGLPVHQEVREKDLARLIRVVRRWDGR